MVFDFRDRFSRFCSVLFFFRDVFFMFVFHILYVSSFCVVNVFGFRGDTFEYYIGELNIGFFEFLTNSWLCGACECSMFSAILKPLLAQVFVAQIQLVCVSCCFPTTSIF